MKPTRETQNEQTPRSTMSSEAQRVAIAEACGWTEIANYPVGNIRNDSGWHAVEHPVSRHHYPHPIPDYLSDLNAMHAAEKVISGWHQQSQYRLILRDVVIAAYDGSNWWLEYELIHATAAQRAEAFLRTLGKWEEA